MIMSTRQQFFFYTSTNLLNYYSHHNRTTASSATRLDILINAYLKIVLDLFLSVDMFVFLFLIAEKKCTAIEEVIDKVVSILYHLI